MGNCYFAFAMLITAESLLCFLPFFPSIHHEKLQRDRNPVLKGEKIKLKLFLNCFLLFFFYFNLFCGTLKLGMRMRLIMIQLLNGH